MSDSCFRADEQEKRGEKVTACGMSSDEIEDLCENYLPYALNPMLSTEEVKEKLMMAYVNEKCCRKIDGVLGLQSTPTVTVLPSASICGCAATSTPTTGA